MGRLDPNTLGHWFDECAGTLVLYARQWLARDLAEEVVQEVFAKLCTHSRQPDAVAAWLFRAVRNACIDRLRRRASRVRTEQVAARAQARWFDESSDPLEMEAVETALRRLPDESREVIVLRIWAGLTFAEVSQITGHPVATLFSRYKNGLAQLRQIMEPPCETKNSI
jgi:RNA polymerase sigma factor (sigma-70 family)